MLAPPTIRFNRLRPNLVAPLRIDLADRRICDFNFEVIDLARMDGARYFSIGSASSLALSALMRMDDTDFIERAVRFTRALAELDLSIREQEAVAGFFFTYRPLEECEARSLRGTVSRIFAGARGSMMRASDYLYLTVPSPSR